MKSLYEKTLELLNETEVPVRTISEESGIPYDWLIGIKYDRIRNPSVNRVQELYEYLSGKKLPV